MCGVGPENASLTVGTSGASRRVRSAATRAASSAASRGRSAASGGRSTRARRRRNAAQAAEPRRPATNVHRGSPRSRMSPYPKIDAGNARLRRARSSMTKPARSAGQGRGGPTRAAAVISGAGRGIGRAVALVFAQAGATVVLAARTEADLEQTAEEIRSEGGEAVVVPTDVTSNAGVTALVERAVAETGRLDVVVNNA